MGGDERNDAMLYARIGVWEGGPEELERWITRSREEVLPNVQRQPGAAGGYLFLDRAAGRALTITLWDSAAAMEASERFRQQTQGQTAAVSGAQVTTERYEVVGQF